MEGDAGASRLNPTDAHEAADEPLAVSPTDPDDDTTAAPTEQPDQPERRPSRLGRGTVAGICAALLLLAGAGGFAGYQLLKLNKQSEDFARADALALQAAKDCVAATHAPDTATMTAAQAKIIECSTGEFAVQAALYSGVLVDAYQAANVSVAVSDMRAAVEKHNDDGTVDVLVAVRVKVTNSSTADQEQGYRLRVQMAPADGTYKVNKLDQVSSA